MTDAELIAAIQASNMTPRAKRELVQLICETEDVLHMILDLVKDRQAEQVPEGVKVQ